jgi:hypothetical protein
MSTHEAELQKLKKENEENEDHYKKKISDFQSELNEYKHNIKSLKLDLIYNKESHTVEKNLLVEQIKLQKLQLENMATKYVTTATVLDSKQSIELSLDHTMKDGTLLKAEEESHKVEINIFIN